MSRLDEEGSRQEMQRSDTSKEYPAKVRDRPVEVRSTFPQAHQGLADRPRGDCLRHGPDSSMADPHRFDRADRVADRNQGRNQVVVDRPTLRGCRRPATFREQVAWSEGVRPGVENLDGPLDRLSPTRSVSASKDHPS